MEKTYVERMQKVLEDDRIVIYYQPQYDSLTNRIVAAEALVRWRPEGGGDLIGPEEFAASLENPKEFYASWGPSDAVLDMDWHILGKICTFLRERRKRREYCVAVAVNFSRHHIKEPDFHNRLCQVVDDYGVPRHLIQIEITEAMMTDDREQLIAVVWDLRSSGFHVAIDNFGGGLSSLALVKDSGANILKVDRSLLRDDCQDPKDLMVLGSIFDFAHRLKMTTVAEGVETEEQLRILRLCNCQRIQGYLMSPPVSEEEFGRLCDRADDFVKPVDILSFQTPSSAGRMLLEAVYRRFSTVLLANATKDSCYLLSQDGNINDKAFVIGVYSDWLEFAIDTLHPADKKRLREQISAEALLEVHDRGETYVDITVRQRGSDGVCKSLEIACYFVRTYAVSDVLVIMLCQEVRELDEAETEEFKEAVENDYPFTRDIEVRR